MIELDGRTGEGGGQLVRNAIALASVVSQPVRIVNVRGNRLKGSSARKPGGGLKAQHVSAIEVLARATDADVKGLQVGSHTLEFRPGRGPSPEALAALLSASTSTAGNEQGTRRLVRIVADSPASSSMLIFQAVFPFLLFAGGASDGGLDPEEKGEEQEPIKLEIEGGTNASWAPSFDYVDQVLCPALQAWFGIAIERRLIRRGWNTGPSGHGKVWFKFRPLRPGYSLGFTAHSTISPRGESFLPADSFAVKTINVTIVSPASMHDKLTRSIVKDLAALFPDADVNFQPPEESGHPSRMFVLLVARPADPNSPVRWGCDMLFHPSSRGSGGGGGKGRKKAGSDAAGGPHAGESSSLSFTEMVSRKVCKGLRADVGLRNGRALDEFLQDQLVIFQALAEGRSSFPRNPDLAGEALDEDGNDAVDSGESLEAATDRLSMEDTRPGPEGPRRDRTDAPFGEGSLHTTTARWVAAELLPGAKWFDQGRICEGIGWKATRPVSR